MVRRGSKAVAIGALALSVSGVPFLAQAANGDIAWPAQTTEEVGIGHDLKTLAFSVASNSKLHAVGSKEETSGGPKDMLVERRKTTDGTLSTGFAGTGYATFGTTGENDILHTTVSTKSISESQALYLVSYNETLGRSEILMVDQNTGAQGSKYVTDTGIRYYAAVSTYEAINDWTVLYVAGTDASGNWIVQSLKAKSDKLGQAWWTASWDVSVAGRPYAITQDDTYVYVGGYSVSGTNEQWHLEKFRKEDGARMWAGGVDIDFSNVAGVGVIDDAIVAMAVNEKGIFAAGYDSGWGDEARWSIKRFNENGASTWSHNGDASMPLGEIRSITVDPEDLYIAGRDASSDEWRIEKRDGETGEIDTADGFGGGDGVVTESKGSSEYISVLAHDGTKMYVGGTEGVGSTKWIVEARDVTEPSISCVFETEPDAGLIREIRDISSMGYLCSDATCSSTLGPTALPGTALPAGKYKIVARSYDNHYIATAKPEQKERWNATITDGGGASYVLPRTTNDLTDYRAYGEDWLEIDGHRIYAALSSITLVHAHAGETNGNSILPACLAFDRYPQCNDGIDNDDGGAGPKDADDDSCHIDGDANDGDDTYDPLIDDEDRTLPACSNGSDDDGDGKTDYGADVGCTDYFDTSEVNPECSDGVDNGDAEDTLVDAADPACHVNNDLDEPYNPFDYNETDSVSSGALQCGDGLDNDGDGAIDTADLGCAGTDDISEFNILRFREN